MFSVLLISVRSLRLMRVSGIVMFISVFYMLVFFFFQAEDGIRDVAVTGVQTCALPISVGMISTISPTAHFPLPWDESIFQKLKEDNDRELEEFQKEEDEAVEKAGDTEIDRKSVV